jgi:predicted enzyme related to lactoylglutathione lyase
VSISIYTITVDCADPRRLSEFWTAVLDYKPMFEDDDEDDEIAIESARGAGPPILFIRVPESKSVKNRIHFDLMPDDQDAEVQRVKQLGAVETDVGQQDVSWVVLADPEGNEFCILSPRD